MVRTLHIFNFFRSTLYCLFFIAVTITLCACPFSSPYKLDKEATVPVDEALLGKWATMIRNDRGVIQPIKMILSRKNETEYFIDFTGDLNDLKYFRIVKDDTIKASAYMSLVADRQFLNIEVKDQTYLSAVVYKNDTLSLMPLADGFTAKYIKSDEQLRTAVQVHCKSWVFPKFDEQFCLKDMVRVN